MRAGRYFWKLFFSHAALIALVLGVCFWLVISHVDRIQDEAITTDLRRLVWTIGLIGLIGALALALGLSILWSGRVFRLTAAAHRLARGDLAAPIDAGGSDEVSLLARSLERMRDRLHRQLITIEHQGRTLESLLAQLHEGVVVSDHNGQIVQMNPAAARFLGTPPSRDERRTAFLNAHVEDLIRHQDLRKMLLSDTVGDKRSDEKSLNIQTDDGMLSVLARAWDITIPAANGDGGVGDSTERLVTGRLLVLTDITELTRAMQVRSDFVTNASHELRTPISAIRAAVDTVLRIDVAKEADDARRFLSVIARHLTRLEALIGDLLDLSRLENPVASFQPVTLQLQHICEELHERWSDAIQGKKLHWQCDVADDCSNIVANSYLLQLVLDNLVDNAVKFTESGGKIVVVCRRAEKSVEIAVRDNGCGIPPSEHQRVFERFYQIETARSGAGMPSDRPRGTGLGLSIVKHAVAAMGGTVRLESTLGQGTRVTVTIPNPQHSITPF